MAHYGVETTIEFAAYDTSANAYKTGDSANFTLRWVKDGTSSAPTNACAEIDATNAPGLYKIVMTAAEMQCQQAVLCGKSSTANVIIIPTHVSTVRVPNATPGGASGLALFGDAMTLADDAITLAKFDESTAFPLVAADAGATAVARVGADSDTLETLSDQLDGVTLTADAVADAVWDEPLSGGTHNVATSAGRRMRSLSDATAGTVNDAAATTLSFVSTLTSAINDFYLDQVIRFTSGNLAGVIRVISAYTGATKLVTFDEALPEAPANGDEFELLPIHSHALTQITEAARAEMDANSTQLAAIVEDTDEVQGDLVDGGRTDLLIDAVKEKTDNLPVSPAAVGSEMVLTAAYDAAKTAAQAGNEMDLVDAPNSTALVAVRTEMEKAGTKLTLLKTLADANLDVAVSSRNAVAPATPTNVTDAAAVVVAALPSEPPTAEQNAAAVVATDQLVAILAAAKGRVTLDALTNAYTFYAADGTTPLFTLTYAAAERTVS